MDCPKCKIPIEEHPADACLNAVFAELVMMWHKGKGRYYGWWMLPNRGGIVYPIKDIDEQDEPRIHRFNPSTNISHAMEGVKIAIEEGDDVLELCHGIGWSFRLGTYGYDVGYATAETAELAITRALILWKLQGDEKCQE